MVTCDLFVCVCVYVCDVGNIGMGLLDVAWAMKRGAFQTGASRARPHSLRVSRYLAGALLLDEADGGKQAHGPRAQNHVLVVVRRHGLNRGPRLARLACDLMVMMMVMTMGPVAGCEKDAKASGLHCIEACLALGLPLASTCRVPVRCGAVLRHCCERVTVMPSLRPAAAAAREAEVK